MSKSSSSRTRSKARAKTSSKSKTSKSGVTATKTVIEPVETAPELVEKTKVLPNLQRWNVWLAVAFVVQAAAILLLSTVHSVAVTTNYLTTNPLVEGHVSVMASRRLFDLNIAYLVTLFLLVAAIEYILVASVYRKQYETEITQGINRMRWIHAAITPSILFVVVALLAGIYDVSTLLLIMVLCTILHGLAAHIELRNRGKKVIDWATGRLAILAGALPFVVLGIYAVCTFVYGSTHLPAYVYGIFGTLVLTFAAFTTNYILQQRGYGRWADYLYGERVYMIINLTTKTAIAWQIFAGLLHS
jgi:hypothetical protein